MRALVTFVYLFLYAPIALVVLFSFNAGRNASEFTGFSTAWYGKALGNTFLVSALQNSLMIAFTSATPVITPGSDKGRVTPKKVETGLAPRSAEASSSRRSSFSRLT